MSGHSHWSGSKYKKAANDLKRGKVFSKIGRLITIAARGGADPDMNAKLRVAIDKGKAVSMPKENIERAIKKGAGADAGSLEEMIYEGYASGGVAFIAEALTDNGNRTTPEIRKIVDSAGAKLGKTGCVSFMFKPKGLFSVKKTASVDAEALMLAALDAGADDVSEEDGVFEIVSEADKYAAVKDGLETAGFTLDVAELTRIADNEVDVDIETMRKVMSLIEKLEDHDDIQNVYTSAKMTSELMAQM